MKNYWILIGVVLMTLVMSSCIDDDIVDDIIPARVRLINPIDTLTIGDTYQLDVNYFDVSGTLDNSVPVIWTTSAPDIISVTPTGEVEAIELGSSTIEATVNNGDASASMSTVIFSKSPAPVVIDTMTSEPMDTMMTSEPLDTTVTTPMDTMDTEPARKFREGTIATTTFYDLAGTFQLIEDDEDLILSINDDFIATSSLPGLYVYLSNNPNSIGNALEIGRVTTFEGAHTFTIEGLGLTDYNYLVYFCKPFVVKVGDAEMGDPN